MESMGRPRVYPDEFRGAGCALGARVARGAGGERRRRDCDLDAAGINRETLRRWVIEQEVETGDRPGLIRAERSRMVELERENKELRRANEILKTAAAYFRAELDRQRKK
jgi:hypothetical protein